MDELTLIALSDAESAAAQSVQTRRLHVQQAQIVHVPAAGVAAAASRVVLIGELCGLTTMPAADWRPTGSCDRSG